MEKDDLQDALEEFKCCHDAETDQRKEALDDLEFAVLGKQWDENDEQKRRDDGRPCLTINRLPSFISQVTNEARKTRPSIITKPVGNGANKETSRILNDLIRNIEMVSTADIVYDTALEFAVSSGVGYFIVRTDYADDDAFDQDILIERIDNPFSVFGDYDSKSATSADWKRAFIVDSYSKTAFDAKWPDAKAGSLPTDGDYTDMWYSDKNIQVAQRWTRQEVATKLLRFSDGAVMHEPEYLKIKDLMDVQGVTVVSDRPSRTWKVTQQLMTGADILETNEWAGKYIPIVPMYGKEINVNGKRHFQSLVRFAKDSQRSFNYWRTCSTELVALSPKAPYVGAVGQFVTDSMKWQRANKDAEAYIEYDLVGGAPPPQRQPFAGVPAGALQEALNASDDMKNIMGLHDASLGAQGNETSGRAIVARQQQGETSTFNFVDNRNRAIEHGGRIIVDLIPKIYNVARILRCIKEDGSTYTVPVNQVSQPVQQPQQAQPMPQPGQNGPRSADESAEFEPAPEGTEHVEGVTKLFDLTTGKYDVAVVAGPSYATKRDESAEQMMEFIRVYPQSAPLIADLLAKNLDWPGADEIASRLKAMLPPQAQGAIPPMVQHLQQQLQQQDGMAKQAVGQLQAQLQDMQKQLADKSAEQQVAADKVKIDGFKAETDRMKAQADIAQGEQQQRDSMIKAANDASAEELAAQPQAPAVTPEMLAMHGKMLLDAIGMSHQALADQASQPAEIVRDPVTQRATGVSRGGVVRSIQRGPDGRVAGLQ